MDGWNYFNYFTEIENYFWKKRGAHLLVSPLDWAIMETWQKAGVPLDAVLKGIDQCVRKLSTVEARRGKAAEEPGVLHGRGAGSGLKNNWRPRQGVHRRMETPQRKTHFRGRS